MANTPLPVDQDLLDEVFLKHASTISNFGVYENIGRTMGVNGKGLSELQCFLQSVLEVAPWCNLHLTQLREAVLTVVRAKDINKSKLNDKVWAGQRAERMITLLAHLRRLLKPFRFEQCASKCSRGHQQRMKELLSLIDEKYHDFANSKTDSPQGKKRKLQASLSNASNLTVDSHGFPALLHSPMEVASQHCEAVEEVASPVISDEEDDLLEQLKLPSCHKKPAAAHVKTFKKPASACGSIMPDLPRRFELKHGYLKLTFATKQSYIHFQDNHGGSTFLTARSASASSSHHSDILELAKSLSKLNHDTGKKMKEAALKLRSW
jgi:hypothetical protein